MPFLRVGVGGGVRIDTPVGPLQMDLAVNPQAAFSQGGRRELLKTAWEEPDWRFHLTLGSLF